jgi:hypothetical protein
MYKYAEHILSNGISRFGPDLDMAEAWDRLIKSNFLQSDLRLLLHEYSELLIMGDKKISWRIAHDIVEKEFPWAGLLKN